MDSRPSAVWATTASGPTVWMLRGPAAVATRSSTRPCCGSTTTSSASRSAVTSARSGPPNSRANASGSVRRRSGAPASAARNVRRCMPEVRAGRGVRSSAETRQVVRELRAPRRPVVRHVVAPEVDLVTDALLREQAGERLRALQRAGRVLPLALAADQQHADAAAEPVQVLAAHVLDVVGGVVEVGRVAALAPADRGDVVHAALADGEREEVGAPQAEVGRVVRAEARPVDGDVLTPAGVGADERHDLVDDPVLVCAVADRALLGRQMLRLPAFRVEARDAVELEAARVEEAA